MPARVVVYGPITAALVAGVQIAKAVDDGVDVIVPPRCSKPLSSELGPLPSCALESGHMGDCTPYGSEPEDRVMTPGTLPADVRKHIYANAQHYITAQDAAALRRVAARYSEPLAVKPGYDRATGTGGGSAWTAMGPDGKVFIIEDGDVWVEAGT
jgi:hypothetical protein